MKALTVEPGRPGSLAVRDRPDPQAGPAELPVRGVAMGGCGAELWTVPVFDALQGHRLVRHRLPDWRLVETVLARYPGDDALADDPVAG